MAVNDCINDETIDNKKIGEKMENKSKEQRMCFL